MRIVSDLNKVKGCPNCRNNILVLRINDFGRPYLFCHDCHEEIFENETARSEGLHAVYKITNPKEEWFEQKRKEKESFVFEMREEISALDWCSHDAKTQILVENLQNILNKIIDYIEEN